jgi:uncharacterized protein
MYALAAYDFSAHIHLFRWQQVNILLDVNSGAVHVLDDLAARLVHLLIKYQGDFYQAVEKASQEYPPEQVMETVTEILTAYENGALFSEPEQVPLNLLELPVKALCLNVAHACNMRCRYCFASQGDFGMGKALMSLKTGQKALDFLVEKSGGVKNLEVDFFGGEPLLNADMIRDLVAYGRQIEQSSQKKFHFTLTTNTMLLDEAMMDFIVEQDMAVILSLDGRREVNDRLRILPDGQGSYDRVVDNIRKMVAKKPISYYVRGTYTRLNLDFTHDFRHLVELGFENLSLEPAIGTNQEFPIQAEDIPAVLAEYERLTEAIAEYRRWGKDLHFFHYNLDLQKGPCLAKRHSGCGAGVDYLAVTPEGDIYPCHQFVGESRFLMGNVTRGELDEEVRAVFANNHLEAKPECLSCWARNFCGGGCHANHYFANGDIHLPNPVACAMHRKRVEGALYLEVCQQAPRG